MLTKPLDFWIKEEANNLFLANQNTIAMTFTDCFDFFGVLRPEVYISQPFYLRVYI